MDTLNKPKILIVDDILTNLLVIEEILKPLDVDIVKAGSGKEAIEIVKKNDFALILCDVVMPGIDGFETIKRIKEFDHTKQVSVIFVSAILKDDNNIIRGLESGAFDYISKPLNNKILLEKTKRYIDYYNIRKEREEFIKQLEGAYNILEENQNLLQNITSSVTDAIILTTTNFEIIFWNKAAEQIFGYTQKEIYKKRLPDLISNEENIEEFINALNQLTLNVEFEARNKSWNMIPVEVSFSTVEINETNHIVGIFRDITERKQIQEQMLKAKEFKEAKESAETANKLKSEFLANMSHEFRTPMNVIIGISNALLKYDISELNNEQIEAIKHIKQSGTRLLDLVNDLLDLAKIESGKMHVKNAPFLLDKLITDLKGMVEELIKDKNIVFTVRKNPNVPDTIVSDVKKLYQILTNLLGNSVKFTKKGKIKLKIHGLNNAIYFEVYDTGIGIAKRHLNRIFDKFSQIDGSEQKKYKGTGLGLALCKELVGALNGSIWAESELGEGTIMRFYIPENTVPTIKTNQIVEKETEQELKTNIRKVLVIENDEETKFFYQKYLENNEYQLIFANNGKQGYKQILQVVPDFIILELKLPLMTGYEILRKIKYKKHICKIPVIIITELDDIPNKAIYNYNYLFQKPVELNELNKALKEIENNKAVLNNKIAIVSENIKELENLKASLEDEEDLVITIQESKKIIRILNDIEPQILICDIDNCAFNEYDLVKAINESNNKNLAYTFIIFYSENQKNDLIRNDYINFVLKDSDSIENVKELIKSHKNDL